MLYFNPVENVIPSLFKRMGSQEAQAPAATTGTMQTLIQMPGGSGADAGTVLVTGATGGVGRRVVARLLAEGRRVRALVRDVGKARQLLAGLPAAPGGGLELAAADVTQRRTLLPEYFAGVRQVVCCSAVKVAPKEGDTVDRAKYYQVGRRGMHG